MFERLNQLIIRCSFSLGKFVFIFVGFSGTLQLLLLITEKFKLQAEGNVPFDMQHTLSASQIYEQLPAYSKQAFLLYYSFSAIDFLFPLFAGFLMATIWAYVLRHTKSRWYETGIQNNLFVLLLIPTFFDYSENISILTTLALWPEQFDAAANAVVIAKRAKLGTMMIMQGATLLLLIYGVYYWVRSRLK